MRGLVFLLCLVVLVSCGNDKPVNAEQIAFVKEWANENATDAQIEMLKGAPPRKVHAWQATVENVREDGDFTIVDAKFRNQVYELWIFESAARERARRLYAKTEIEFFGDLLEEKSLTLVGARSSPEFGVYPLRVVGGGLEIIQTTEGVARQYELDRQAIERGRVAAEDKRRDSENEKNSIVFCKDLVIKKLELPVSGDFSWFQGKIQKESNEQWVYTDIVNSVTGSGGKSSVRFVCTVTIRGKSIEGRVKFLK